ncbi:MAG: hypothetical protein ABI430_02100 [Candidatus Taylorbacteria bacterium]
MITFQKQKLKVRDVVLTFSPYRARIKNRYVGRPVFDGKDENEVVAKLQYVSSIGGTAQEACNLAGISTDSFYRYCKNNPEFRNKIELLQATPILLARKAIFQALLNGDVKSSWRYLELKRPHEFSSSAVVAFQLTQQEQRIEHLERLLRENNIDPI